jgi:hypothetical protein
VRCRTNEDPRFIHRSTRLLPPSWAIASRFTPSPDDRLERSAVVADRRRRGDDAIVPDWRDRRRSLRSHPRRDAVAFDRTSGRSEPFQSESATKRRAGRECISPDGPPRRSQDARKWAEAITPGCGHGRPLSSQRRSPRYGQGEGESRRRASAKRRIPVCWGADAGNHLCYLVRGCSSRQRRCEGGQTAPARAGLGASVRT